MVVVVVEAELVAELVDEDGDEVGVVPAPAGGVVVEADQPAVEGGAERPFAEVDDLDVDASKGGGVGAAGGPPVDRLGQR